MRDRIQTHRDVGGCDHDTTDQDDREAPTASKVATNTDTERAHRRATRRDEISDAEIVSRYLAGDSMAKIASDLECSGGLVLHRLKRQQVARRPKALPSVRPSKNELRKLYADQGLSLAEIGTMYGVSKQAVRRWMVLDDSPLRPPASPCDVDIDEIAARYEAGLSVRAVAELTGTGPVPIVRALNAAGVARRSTRSRLTRELLAGAIEEGLNAAEIAYRNGVSITTVCRALLRHDLQTPAQQARQRSADYRSARPA